MSTGSDFYPILPIMMRKAILRVMAQDSAPQDEDSIRSRVMRELHNRAPVYGFPGRKGKDGVKRKNLPDFFNEHSFRVFFCQMLVLCNDGILVPIEQNGCVFFNLSNRLQGTPVSRLKSLIENTASHLFPDENPARARFTDIMNLSRFAVCVWTTTDESLRTEGTRTTGALFIPSEINMDPSGVSVTRGHLILVSETGYIRWFNICDDIKRTPQLYPQKGTTATYNLRLNKRARKKLFRFEKTDTNSRGWELVVRTDLLPETVLPVDVGLLRLLPKTSVAYRHSAVVKVSVSNAKGILTALGGNEKDAGFMTRRLKGPQKSIKPHVINKVFGLLLPREAMVAMRRLPACTINEWNTINHTDEIRAVRRRQFIVSHKGLWCMLYGNYKYPKIVGSMLEMIDSGNSVLPFLSEYTGLPVSIVRLIISTPWQRLLPSSHVKKCAGETVWHDGFMLLVWSQMLTARITFADNNYDENMFGHDMEKRGQILKECLAVIAPEWFPKTNLQWYLFIRAVCYACSANDIRMPYISTVMKLLRRHGGNWNTIEQETSVYAGIRETNDALRWLKNNIEGCLQGVPVTPEIMNLILYGGKTPDMRDISRTSMHWHASGEIIREAMNRISAIPNTGQPEVIPDQKPENWISFTEEKFLPLEGGSAIWLTSPEMLDAESNVMKHCVWSYKRSCRTLNAHIASLVHCDGSRSTFHMNLRKIDNPDGTAAFVTETIQHRSVENAFVSPSCAELARQLEHIIQTVSENRKSMLFSECEQRMKYEPSIKNKSRHLYDFDHKNPFQGIEVHALLGRFMGGKWRRMDYGTFRHEVGLLVENPEPE